MVLALDSDLVRVLGAAAIIFLVVVVAIAAAIVASSNVLAKALYEDAFVEENQDER